MAEMTIRPARSLQGAVVLPGDKSISHRALMLSAISDGGSTISGLSAARDVASTRGCIEALGVGIEGDRDRIRISGVGLHGLRPPAAPLDAGNSGTTLRLMAGLLAAQPFETVIDGDSSLRRRPMRRIIEPLEAMGARIEGVNLRAPLTIHGGPLHAVDYASPVASAQVKSCILLAGLYARGVTRVTEPHSSRDHTERMLAEFGVRVQSRTGMAGLGRVNRLEAADIDVPGDLSAAAFFIAAACMLPGSSIEMDNVGVNATRTGFIETLSSMGACLSQDRATVRSNEPRARLTALSSSLRAVQISGSMIPRIIDEIPVLAVAASQADGATVIRDAAELRVKESDRIATVCANLKKMGAKIRETRDGMVIRGPVRLQGAEIDCHGDHRIAMAFAVAALAASSETRLVGTECVDISFPGFFQILESLRRD